MSAGNPEIVFADREQINRFISDFISPGYVVDMTVDWLGAPIDITFEFEYRSHDAQGMTVLVGKRLALDEHGFMIPGRTRGSHIGEHAEIEWAHIHRIEFH